jgi:hypothetical protein
MEYPVHRILMTLLVTADPLLQRGFAKNRMNLSLVCNHSLGFQHPSKVNNLRAGDKKIVRRITHIPRKRFE